MKFVTAFESFNKVEEKPRPEKKPKVRQCIGKCDRQFYIKDGKPIVHCPSCNRIFSIEN